MGYPNKRVHDDVVVDKELKETLKKKLSHSTGDYIESSQIPLQWVQLLRLSAICGLGTQRYHPGSMENLVG